MTNTPKWCTSAPSTLLRLASAALEAEYQPPNGAGAVSFSEVTLMIRPPPWPRMTGSAALASRIGPNTFTSKIRCASASPASSSGARLPAPALLTSTSSRPAAASTERTAAGAAAASATSSTSGVTPSGSGTADGFRDPLNT